MTSEMSMAEMERRTRAIGSAALELYGLKRSNDERPVSGAVITAAGTG